MSIMTIDKHFAHRITDKNYQTEIKPSFNYSVRSVCGNRVKMKAKIIPFLLLIGAVSQCAAFMRKRPEDKTKCPTVQAIRNFDLEQMLGEWYVIQYYASSEEALSYRCMRAEFTMTNSLSDVITMNFTYSFTDDPINELLIGNITWTIPHREQPAHWTHSEDTYEGVYNTYVLDANYSSWALLLHCAEKSKVPRYLSSFVMSREPVLGVNVVSYLREKLPRYDIDLSYMFEMTQNDCNTTVFNAPEDGFVPPAVIAKNRPPNSARRHPMKHHHPSINRK